MCVAVKQCEKLVTDPPEDGIESGMGISRDAGRSDGHDATGRRRDAGGSVQRAAVGILSPRGNPCNILRPDSGPGHDATGTERISFTAQTGLWCLPVGSLHRSGADICDVLASDAALSTYAGHGHSLVARKGRPKKADALRKVALESF